MYFGGYKNIERILIALVIVMSLCFFITAIIVSPNIQEIISGLIPRKLKQDDLWIALALIGTTVVPYNLFLHASIINKNRELDVTLRDIKIENSVSIILGGLISILIVITAATSQGHLTEVTSAKDLAIQLEPLFGAKSKLIMGIGLLAAGVSSALTAPLAAAYVAKGLFNWKNNESDWRFKVIWMSILVIGVLVCYMEINAIVIIKFAQVSNALLLPLIAIFLFYVCNNHDIMKGKTNSKMSNISGIIVIAICFLISMKTLFKVIS